MITSAFLPSVKCIGSIWRCNKLLKEVPFYRPVPFWNLFWVLWNKSQQLLFDSKLEKYYFNFTFHIFVFLPNAYVMWLFWSNRYWMITPAFTVFLTGSRWIIILRMQNPQTHSGQQCGNIFSFWFGQFWTLLSLVPQFHAGAQLNSCDIVTGFHTSVHNILLSCVSLNLSCFFTGDFWREIGDRPNTWLLRRRMWMMWALSFKKITPPNISRAV